MRNWSNKVYIKKSLKAKFNAGTKYSRAVEDQIWEVDSEDLDDDFDSDEEQKHFIRSKVKTSKPKMLKKSKGRKFKHEVDTNVMSIDLSVLKNQVEMATGDPIFCKRCRGVFNWYSQLMQNYHLVESDGIISQSSSFYANEKIWICEFCQTRNNINIDKEEIPKKDTVNYILEIENAKEEAKLKSTDDVSLVFCIDTSGSMGTGVYHDGISVKRKPPIKISPFYYGKKSQIQEQYVPTTSSRLDYIKDAIKSNINEMDSFTCKTKVGLVTFGCKVSIIGDGTLPSDEISDLSTLYNF